MAQKKTRGEPSAERFPNVAIGCNRHGWIEAGDQWQDNLFARALHEGGLAWGGEGSYVTIDDALRALDGGIKAFMEENGWE